jgi:hypothetical protein
MFSKNQNSPSQDNNAWSPSLWDMYGNASQVLEGLKRKADVRVNFSSRELGSDAGRFVLDQYYAAKGETGVGTYVQSFLSLDFLKLVLTKILPLAGFIAAIGIDYAVFDSASKGMGSTNMPFGFKPFAFGSLVFAAGLGISTKNRSWFLLTMVAATVGASLISSDNKTLREGFANTFASVIDKSSDSVKTKISELNKKKNIIEKDIKNLENEIKTGGNNGKPMDDDGNPYNDSRIKQILAEIEAKKKSLEPINDSLTKIEPTLSKLESQDGVGVAGRVFAALYTSAWLIAALLMVSSFISGATKTFNLSRSLIASRVKQKKFFLHLENSDTKIRNDAIQAAVNATLSRFSEILSTSKPDSKNSQKHDNFAALFEKDSYNEMVTTATAIVSAGIIPKKS